MKICIHRVFKAYASISIRLVLIELQQAVQKFDYQDWAYGCREKFQKPEG